MIPLEWPAACVTAMPMMGPPCKQVGAADGILVLHGGPPCVCRKTSTEGAYAICLSGGYKDNDDRGDTFLYTGEGGQEKNKQVWCADQPGFDNCHHMPKALEPLFALAR